MKPFCERGFTLVELMIAVAVIAVLAAILVPNFVGQAQRARESAAMDVVANVRKGLAMYEADKGEYPSGSSWGAVRDAISEYVRLPSNLNDTWLESFSYSRGTAGYVICARPKGSPKLIKATPESIVLGAASCP